MQRSAKRLLEAFERILFIDADLAMPSDSGVYFVVNKQGTIIYIGQSRNMLRRWKEGHHKALAMLRNGAKYIYFQFTEEPYDIEQIYIEEWEPALNDRTSALWF